jgi:hypothetical protein
MAGYTTRADNGEIVFAPESFVLQVLDTDLVVNNSDTLVTVPALSFAIGKYERYALRYTFHFTTANAAGDPKYLVDAPASPTLFRQTSWQQHPLDTALTTPAIATAEGAVNVADADAGNGFILVNLLLVNGANAGNVNFQFAQQAAHASDTTLRAGSYIEIRKF